MVMLIYHHTFQIVTFIINLFTFFVDFLPRTSKNNAKYIAQYSIMQEMLVYYPPYKGIKVNILNKNVIRKLFQVFVLRSNKR